MLFKIILLVILVLIDWYVFQAIKITTRNISLFSVRSVYWGYWGISFVFLLYILLSAFLNYKFKNGSFHVYMFAVIVIVYVSKMLVVLFLIIDDLIRLFQSFFFVVDKYFIAPKTIAQNNDFVISRWEFISRLGLLIAAIPFVSLIYGMFGNIYNYQIRKIKIRFPKMPDAFNGLKIVQLSDIHIGSFTSEKPLKKIVRLIKEQKPDMILLTGDLVNNKAEEALPFLHLLKEIQAPMGVFSVLGNHDYGDYHRWESQHAKKENFNELVSLQKNSGWNLLRNEHVIVAKGTEKIAVTGVENWSALGRFHRYGNMQQATDSMPDVALRILLSHDPSHWEKEITEKYTDIDLTFSGHTHGMQFGVDIPGFKWSPVQYIYKYWAGLYRKNKQYLYVNRGLGFLGYPGRVGIMPEITVVELEKGEYS